MSPLGKLTLALLGLRLFGANGFFIGLFLGHLLIDKTFVIRRIENEINLLDDIIRVKLPYKYYRYYNRLDGNVWGKIWGAVLGSLLFGCWGFILLTALGQVAFDMPKNADIRRFKKNTDHFFDNHWGKVLGFIVGFVLESPVLIFVGLVLGFIFDYQRLEGAKLLPFECFNRYFQKINPLKLWRHAQGGEHKKYLETMAALAAKVVKANSKISARERDAFRQVFAVKEEKDSFVKEVFENAKKHAANVEKYAAVLETLTRGNENLKEVSLENLFKIAAADAAIGREQMRVLKEIAQIINLDDRKFAELKLRFKPKPINEKLRQSCDVLGVDYDAPLAEVKAKWKKMIVIYHPDKMGEASEEELKIATARMAEINLAYQEIVKIKGKK